MQNITPVDTIAISANIGGHILTIAVPVQPLEEAPEFIDLEGALDAAREAVLAAYDTLTGEDEEYDRSLDPDAFPVSYDKLTDEAEGYDPDPDEIDEAKLWATVEDIENNWAPAGFATDGSRFAFGALDMRPAVLEFKPIPLVPLLPAPDIFHDITAPTPTAEAA